MALLAQKKASAAALYIWSGSSNVIEVYNLLLQLFCKTYFQNDYVELEFGSNRGASETRQVEL